MRAATPIMRLIGLVLIATSASGLTVTGYLSATNDRFTSGFPTAPVENASGSIFGQGLDWSGVAWSTTTYESGSYKGFAMLSPKHFLTAQHYEYENRGQRTQGLRILDREGVTQTSNIVEDVFNLGYGIELQPTNAPLDHDLAIGILADIPTTPSKFNRIALLDLHTTSNSINTSNYLGNVVIYGRGPSGSDSHRAGNTTINRFFNNGGDADQPVLETTQADVTFELGDSGSPALRVWENPNGADELTVLGLNSAVGSGFNYVSFFPIPGAISAAQSAMAGKGFAPRIVGDTSNTWVGSSSTRIDRNSAWGIGGNPNASGATSDKYVLFDPSTASSSSATVQTNYNLRGLYFKNSVGTGDGFSFSGGSTLTIGRGGITNYDNDTQAFSNGIALGTPQFWSIEDGGVTLSSLDTNGHLLEIGGGGNVSISGTISDSGGIAISDGTLTLSGNSSYTGSTWAHGGNLIVHGDIDNSSSLTIDSYGTLSGTGSVPGIQGSGKVSPGNSPGILTAESVDPSGGLDFDFEFTAASAPDFGNASTSINDLIRITDGTPFKSALDADNTVRIFLNSGALSNGQTFRGGFFTDSSSDFIASISSATFEFYIADGGGNVSFGGQTYSLYDGPYLFALTTESQTADFGQGNISGRIMQFVVTPDVTQYEGWKIFYGLTGNAALNTADDDADDIELILEFGLGGDPTVNDVSILPTLALTDDSGSTYLELNLTRPDNLQNIDYTPQTTDDLASWPLDSTGILEPDPMPVSNGNGTETLTYRRAQAISGTDKAFIRVDITESAP